MKNGFKLKQILLDNSGNKESVLIELDGEIKRFPVNNIINYIQHGGKVHNAVIINNELFFISKNGKFKDISKQIFYQIYVREYLGNQYYACECTCGKIWSVKGQALCKGETKSCGHATTGFKDLTGQTIGEIYVHRYLGSLKYECECSCGKIWPVFGQSLRAGETTSCGHNTTGFKDLTGQIFNNIKVLGYIGNGQYNCECSCGRIFFTLGKSIRQGKTKSCGHCGQTEEQLRIISNKDNFEAALLSEIECLGRKLYIEDVIELTGLSESKVYKYISLYNAQQYIEYRRSSSRLEDDIFNYINNLYPKVKRWDKDILNRQELDIVVPDKYLAIECNGVYWHDIEHTPKNYHQDKTLQCVKKGIRLIHIFEHEWYNEQTEFKIKVLLEQALDINQTIIYARDTCIKEISNSLSDEFLNKYHLQSSISANTCLGLFYNNELIEVMTFGRSRFNSNYSTELLRLCTKAGYKIIGGALKLLTYYIEKYNPKNIITYCDISKFTGKVYEQIGMKFDGLTKPDYFYVTRSHNFEVLSRLQCQKYKLLEKGWGTAEQTEKEIMYSHGYVQCYNSGYAVYVYNRD